MYTLFSLLLILILLVIVSPSLRKLSLKQFAAVSLLIALASVGRFLFASIPSVQPSTYIVIVCGGLFGIGGGYTAGIFTGLLSNLMLGGLSFYTPWQMLLWGLIGIVGALLFNNKLLLIIAAFLSGFVFGWVMNLCYYSVGNKFILSGFLLACASSFTFDLFHALTNVGLLVATLPIIKRIEIGSGFFEQKKF